MFFGRFISNRNEKKIYIDVFNNKLIYLVLAILEISKILVNEYSYDYVKLKYGEKAKFCYMDTDSFTVRIITNGIYAEIAKEFESRFSLESLIKNTIT